MHCKVTMLGLGGPWLYSALREHGGNETFNIIWLLILSFHAQPGTRHNNEFTGGMVGFLRFVRDRLDDRLHLAFWEGRPSLLRGEINLRSCKGKPDCIVPLNTCSGGTDNLDLCGHRTGSLRDVASFLKSMLSPRYSSVVLSIPGVVLITIGLVIFIMSLRDFGRSWRVGIDKDTSDKLVTAGIFSVSRNPMFLFLDMYFIGIALIYPNFFFMLSCLIVIPGLHYQILQEEKFLLSKYGEEYERYKSRVRRYI